jgi:hypothetical protein
MRRPWLTRDCSVMVKKKKRENKDKAYVKKETIDARLHSSRNEAECAFKVVD